MLLRQPYHLIISHPKIPAPFLVPGVQTISFAIVPTGFQRMKSLVAIVALAVSAISNAETLSFPFFQIEIQDGWAHSIERGPQAHDEVGELISVYHPNGSGILKVRSYNAPAFVSQEILRNMTNVPSSEPLTWQDWGEYSGYQYDYLESGSFLRQWWLTDERTIIFIVYDSHIESKDIEIDEINNIVSSITINAP
jgi:hypothetical protein